MNRFHDILGYFIVATFLIGCSNDRWYAIFYPDKSDLSEYQILGVYSTIDDCRMAVLAYKPEAEDWSRSDYECGLSCEFREDLGDHLVCDDTQQ